MTRVLQKHKVKVMKPKRTKQTKIEALKQKARKLYALGYTTREVGHEIKKSHAWVALVVKDLQGLDKSVGLEHNERGGEN